jgi:hypothetical protein
VPPRKGGEEAPAAAAYEQCFVRLTDGSVLRAANNDGLALVRFPKLPLAPERLVALWGSKTDLLEPKDEDWKEGAAVMYNAANEAQPVADWRLGKDGIEAASLPELKAAYADSPLFWFKKPSARRADAGVLRLISGEEIVLAPEAGAEGFSLVEWTASQVTIASGEEKWTIPMAEAASLVLPGRGM